jgi:hypothetical protein
MALDLRKHVDGSFDLYRNGQPVGRIRGRSIELHGFWDRADAERAVNAVGAALARWLPLQRGTPPLHGRIDIAPWWPDLGVLGFEITLPEGTTAEQVLRAARVAHHTAFQGAARYSGTRFMPQVTQRVA